jgi:MGT family glycosyltransferase
MIFTAMNLLAFAPRTVCDCLEQLWTEARAAERARTRFFEHIRIITAYLVFPDWTALMQTLIDSLAGTRFRVVVSLGPQHDQLRLADNLAGAEFLPQASILPQVDAVITHGGNNTVTECLHAGRPMVLLPLFWDQYDNAQRMHECGLGLRLPTYDHAPAQLTGALEALLGDAALRRRLDAISRRLRAAPGTVAAADAIERVGAA